MSLIIIATAVATAACPARAAPAMLTPAAAIAPGEAPRLAVTGAPPNARVRVEARRPEVFGRPLVYRSAAVFVADACGRVSLDQAPVSGSWAEADPRGALWSMTATRDRPAAGWTRDEVRLTADLGDDGSIDAAGALRFAGDISALTEVPLGPEHPGAFFIHPEPGTRRPTVVLLGGSEGGDGSARSKAAAFLTRGYAVLGLPYYDPGYDGSPIAGLPRAFVDIPLDRMEGVLAWLRARDDVGRVGLYGVSKGAEFALAAASRIEGIDAVVAIVPTDVIWEGWGADAPAGTRSSYAWRGQPLAFVPYEGMQAAIAELSQGRRATLRVPHDRGRAANPDRVAAARIAVEAIDAPVLVAGGDRDTVWGSADMARAIGETRRAAGLTTTVLTYPDAGHGLSGTGDVPATAADARAQREVFAATLALFAEALGKPGARGGGVSAP